jgi:glycine/D-amino acid oxidase-like deaminating enzyme
MFRPEPDRADVIVAGGGIVGAATFFELASRGHAVTLVERAIVASGATAWSGGVVRLMHDDSESSDRAVQGFEFYRSLRRRGVGVPFNVTGFLYFPRPEREAFARAEVERLSQRVPIEWLDAHGLERRFGHVLADTRGGAVHEPWSGYVDAREVTRALVRAGIRHGGRLVEGVELHGLTRDGDHTICAHTSAGDLDARAVVLATGVRTPGLLDALGIEHDLFNRDIQVDLRAPADGLHGQPAFIDDVYDLNGRPDADSGAILIGHPTGLDSASLDASPIRAEHSRRIVEEGRKRFAWIDSSESRGGRRHPECYAPDPLARVHAADERGDIVIATGFSGGGLKMAPWTANRVVSLLTDVISPIARSTR